MDLLRRHTDVLGVDVDVCAVVAVSLIERHAGPYSPLERLPKQTVQIAELRHAQLYSPVRMLSFRVGTHRAFDMQTLPVAMLDARCNPPIGLRFRIRNDVDRGAIEATRQCK